MHHSPSIALSESIIVAGFAALAAMKRLDRRMRASLVTIGLVSASSALVHLSGGYIEAHFHFFIILVFIILYHDWLPFLLALGVTALHHGITGTLAPSMVYNHPAAIASPWLWAGIHAGAVLAESVGILMYWRLHEVDALELRRSEQLVTSIVTHLPDMLFVKDAKDLSFARLNKVGEELLGLSQSECLGKTAYDFFTKEEADFFTAKDRKVLDRGLLDISEEPIQTKDKGVRILHTKRVPILDDVGRPRYLVGISDDITERRQTELALQEQEQRLRAIVDNAVDGIITIDDRGLVETFNPSAERLFGYAAAEIIGQPITQLLPELYHSEHDGFPADGHRASVPTLIGVTREVDARHKDGATFPIELAVSEMRLGDCRRFTGLVHDISQRKRAEWAVKASEERLNLAVTAAHIGIFEHDHRENTLYWSPLLRDIYGVSPEEPGSLQRYLGLIHQADRDRVVSAVQRAHDPTGDGEFHIEHQIVRPDGDVRYLSLHSRTSFDVEGTARVPTRTIGTVMDITARKQAEERLTHGRDLLKSFVEHTPAAVAMFDKNLRYVAVSKRWLQDYTLGDQDLIGQHHYDVFPEIRQYPDWQAVHQRCLAGAVERREEDCFVRKDGNKDWLRWEVRPWHDEFGEIGGIIMFTEVITERKQMEESLRDKEELFRTFLDFAPSAMFMKTTEGRYVLTNRYFEQVCRSKRESIVGKTDAELFPRDIADQYQANDRRVLEAEQAIEFEETSRNGDELDTNIVVKFPVRDRVGRIYATGGIATNITARKRAETAVQEQETRLRAIVDNAVDGIITIDEWGTIESFNPAAERLFGYTAAEMIGQNVKRLMPEPYQSEHDGYLARYCQTGQAKAIGIGSEIVGLRKDGSTFPGDLAVSEMRLGDRRYFTGIVRDITERKEVEHKLEQSAFEWECQNIELVTVHKELVAVHEQALASTRAKSQFLASMSHEIRTPMNAIVAMAELLQETPLSKEQQEYVGRFSRAATSLLDLINDILDISKIEAGHVDLESIAFDIHDLVDKIA
jgi:PAS domain S-box-containing protein